MFEPFTLLGLGVAMAVVLVMTAMRPVPRNNPFYI